MWIFVTALYLFFALATFGHLFRTSPKLKPKYIAYAAAWPVYWMLFHGFGATFRMATSPMDDSHFWLIVALFSLGHFLGTTPDNCNSLWSCGYLSAKSVAVFIGFPVYWGLVLAT